MNSVCENLWCAQYDWEETGFVVTVFTEYVWYSLLGFHCIVHEEALSACVGLKNVERRMKAVTRVTNYIFARALKKTQFQNLVSETNSMYKTTNV
jgi:hypothetical protein